MHQRLSVFIFFLLFSLVSFHANDSSLSFCFFSASPPRLTAPLRRRCSRLLLSILIDGKEEPKKKKNMLLLENGNEFYLTEIGGTPRAVGVPWRSSYARYRGVTGRYHPGPVDTTAVRTLGLPWKGPRRATWHSVFPSDTVFATRHEAFDLLGTPSSSSSSTERSGSPRAASGWLGSGIRAVLR
jgi:hypothetical protein